MRSLQEVISLHPFLISQSEGSSGLRDRGGARQFLIGFAISAGYN